jgi:SpoU rRNA methylase family enzyme
MRVIFHNFASQIKLEEMARTALAFGADLIVISKATGMAAQAGIPTVSRLIFEKGGRLLVCHSLEEALEVLKPKKVYLITDLAEKELKKEEIKEGNAYVFFGNYPVKKEEEMGEMRYIAPKGLSEIAQVCMLFNNFSRQLNNNG